MLLSYYKSAGILNRIIAEHETIVLINSFAMSKRFSVERKRNISEKQWKQIRKFKRIFWFHIRDTENIIIDYNQKKKKQKEFRLYLPLYFHIERRHVLKIRLLK